MNIQLKHPILTFVSLFALISASACDTEPSVTAPDAGDAEPSVIRLPGFGFGSECGGYPRQTATLLEERDYCDAEVLQWSYDAAAEMLSVTHERFETNCCVDLSAHAQLDGTQYQIVEVELPEYGDDPCGCKCVFDVAISVPIPAEESSIEFAFLFDGRARWNEKQETRWSGTLDLTAGAGEIVLSEEESSFCPSDSLP